jgi:hypothetical protein
VAQLLSWQIWTIAALVIVLGWVFEASFRAHRRLLSAVGKAEAAKDQAEAEVIALREMTAAPEPRSGSATHRAFRAHQEREYRQLLGVDVRADALRMTLENTEAFERSQVHSDHIIRKWCVCVENIDPSHFITNCKLHGDFNGAHNLLNNIGTLNATEKRFVEIATHHEAPFDQFIHIQAPRAGGFFSEAYNYLKLPLSETLLTLHATSAETKPAQLICRLFVDEAGKLRMEKA